MDKSETFVVSEGTDSRGYWSILNTETTVYEETAFVDRWHAVEAVRLLNKPRIKTMTNDTQSTSTVQDEIDYKLRTNQYALVRLWESISRYLTFMKGNAETALHSLASDNMIEASVSVNNAQATAITLGKLQDHRAALEAERDLLMMLRRTAIKSAEVLS